MKKKTKTLGGADPSVSLYPGHVGSRIFNKAFKAEGWSGCNRITNDELEHEWWKPGKRKWKRVEKGTKGAKPFTANYW